MAITLDLSVEDAVRNELKPDVLLRLGGHVLEWFHRCALWMRASAASIRMMAASALEESPPQRLKKGNEPRDALAATGLRGPDARKQRALAPVPDTVCEDCADRQRAPRHITGTSGPALRRLPDRDDVSCSNHRQDA